MGCLAIAPYTVLVLRLSSVCTLISWLNAVPIKIVAMLKYIYKQYYNISPQLFRLSKFKLCMDVVGISPFCFPLFTLKVKEIDSNRSFKAIYRFEYKMFN